MALLLQGRVLTPQQELADGWVLVDNGIVAEVGQGAPPACRERAGGPDHILTPGFIDLQVNGFAGHDVAQGAEAVAEISRHLPRTGVTAFLPTLITAPLDEMIAACEAARRAPTRGARVLGVHLEGPFLNPARAGAHDPSLMLIPSRTAVRRVAAARPRLVTLAPELPGAGEAIRELTGHGALVAAGHSAASYEEGKAGIAAGVRFATHLFNAMTAWQHREPGLVGAVLTDPVVTAGLIADGVHVHPAGLEIAIRLRGPERIALTTDAIALAGAPAGCQVLNGREVRSDGRAARLRDGTLAGGIETMDRLVRLVAGLPGVGLRRAVEMATLSPARALGEVDLGRIATGLPADLALLGPDLQIELTLVGGEVVFRKESHR
ncbi:MAG TPA: N-acetylglucosamine-6-phosphate deacetylase [Candidatus Dormibacteraeota bacterium]|nr:N-acetylglucosamine-6-phosphate deacetylase [Candidatus Dormibacteraeota bacterium]